MRYTCRWLLQVIIGGLLISSCVTNSSLPLPTDQLTASTTHLETPSVSPTKPEATQTNVPTPSLIPTLTPPVTLEPEKAADEIKRLISEKPDCQAPCLWGIVPEQTTQGEAFNFFTGLGFPMTPGASNGVYSSTPGFDNLWVKIKLYVQDQVVRGVWARLDLSNYDGPVKPRPWAGFSPDTVLLQYGKPSRVEFALYHPTEPGDATGKVWYEMVIWFDEKKVIADYFDGETRAGSVVRVCPLTDRFGSVDIRIGENPNAPLPKKVLLENATSLTIDQFYELMIQKDGPKCLDLKLEAFPEK